MRLAVFLGLWGGLASGCYASHVRGSGPDGGRIDGGADAPVEPSGDAPRHDVPVDAGPADAPGCTLVPEDQPMTVCGVRYPGGLVAGEPFDLTIQWSSCRCEPQRRCEVTVTGEVVELRPESCDTPEICDECTFEGTCHVPSLSPGLHRLRVAGRDLYDIEMGPRAAARLARPICFEIAAPPDDSLACNFRWDADLSPAQVCFRRLEDVGTFVHFTVTAGCRGCFDWTAGCAVERGPDEIIVRPRVQSCDCPTCGACADVCVPRTVECRSPALRDGLYQVMLESDGGVTPVGELVVSDVPGPGEELCTAVVIAP